MKLSNVHITVPFWEEYNYTGWFPRTQGQSCRKRVRIMVSTWPTHKKNPKFSITVFSDATQTHPVNNFRFHQFFAVDADFIIAIRLWCSAYHGNGSDTRPLMYVSHIGIYECMPDTWLETIHVTEAGPHLNIKTVFHGCGSRDRLIFDMGSQYW